MPVGKRSTITHGERSKLAPGSRLPPEVVRASQRERLMVALVEVVDRQGLQATTVAHLIKRARVSRAAFYEQFESLEDCFLQTYDTHTARAGVQLLAAYDAAGESWPKRIDAGMRAFTAAAAVWPAAARVCLSDILTAGPAAGERNEQAIALIRHMLRLSRDADSDRSPVSKQAAVAIAGGLRRVMYKRLRSTTDKVSPELAGELTGWLLACSPPSLTALELRGEAPSLGAAKRKSARGGAGHGSDSPGDGDSETPAVRVAQDGADAGSEPPANGDGNGAHEERRERIVEAVLELAATKGCKATTHREIATRARVSYSTFYNHFANKQEALLAACEVAHERLAAHIAPAVDAAPDWAHGVSDGLAAYLRAAVEHPREARLVGSEIFSLGRPGVEHVDRHGAYFEQLLDGGYELHPQSSRIAAEALAGAAIELLRHYTSEGRLSDLADGAPELAYIALAPFIGRKDAQRIARYRPPYPAAGEEASALERAAARPRSLRL